MADKRKLLAEVQLTLKKVDEGMLAFDEIYEKWSAAEQQAVKEKCADNLKTELKKLQRFREQIKAWAGNKDIKDMNELTEKRKIIEVRMEQFKICEKDTKLKAYSREGLSRETKVDPREQEKDEKRSWIRDCIEKLEEVNESLESELEKLDTAKLRSKNKEQIEMLDKRMKKSKWHVDKLESILRKLDNDELEPANINSIKDDVEYYIETAAEDVAFEDESDIYEDLHLESVFTPTPSVGPDSSTASDASQSPLTSAASTAIVPDPPPVAPVVVKKGLPTPEPKAVVKALLTPKAAVAAPDKSIAKTTAAPAASVASVLKDASSSSPRVTKVTNPVAEVVQKPAPALKEPEAKVDPPSNSWASTIKANTPAPVFPPTASTVASGKTPSATSTSPQVPSGQAAPSQPGSSPVLQPESSKIPEQQQQQQPAVVAALQTNQPSTSQLTDDRAQSTNTSPAPVFDLSLLNALKASSFFSSDSQSSVSSNALPFPTHQAFPQQVHPGLDSTQYFDKLSVELLFYIFYYQSNTYAMYQAAKVLKEKHNFRFHKQFNRWFQREEGEAHRITQDFEFGNYKYFDYIDWRLIVKKDFKFEYAFVENELV